MAIDKLNCAGRMQVVDIQPCGSPCDRRSCQHRHYVVLSLSSPKDFLMLATVSLLTMLSKLRWSRSVEHPAGWVSGWTSETRPQQAYLSMRGSMKAVQTSAESRVREVGIRLRGRALFASFLRRVCRCLHCKTAPAYMHQACVCHEMLHTRRTILQFSYVESTQRMSYCRPEG